MLKRKRRRHQTGSKRLRRTRSRSTATSSHASTLVNSSNIDRYFEPNVARRIFAQIVLGIAALHQAGYVHRDIKDENVVIDADYNVKVIDFGSARRIPTKKEDFFTTFHGTAGFDAPESRFTYQGPPQDVW
jgi:serine/threonine protein kinase